MARQALGLRRQTPEILACLRRCSSLSGQAQPAFFHPAMPGPRPRGPPAQQPEYRLRGHERPRTPPKRAPTPTRPARRPERKASPPSEPEPPVQGQASPQPVEAMFRDVMVANQQDLESQIEALLPGSDPDEYVKDGMTLFTQYVYFRLQYWYNKYPHRWPLPTMSVCRMFKHAAVSPGSGSA